MTNSSGPQFWTPLKPWGFWPKEGSGCLPQFAQRCLSFEQLGTKMKTAEGLSPCRAIPPKTNLGGATGDSTPFDEQTQQNPETPPVLCSPRAAPHGRWPRKGRRQPAGWLQATCSLPQGCYGSKAQSTNSIEMAQILQELIGTSGSSSALLVLPSLSLLCVSDGVSAMQRKSMFNFLLRFSKCRPQGSRKPTMGPVCCWTSFRLALEHQNMCPCPKPRAAELASKAHGGPSRSFHVH